MEKQLKPYALYWVSEYSKPYRKGYTTPKFSAHVMTFDKHENALAVHDKLQKLKSIGGNYKARRVVRVSPVCFN